MAAADLLRRRAPRASRWACVYLLAKYADLTVNGQSQAIMSILVIGAGTDYALLLVARYREELRRHEDRHEAMAFALHRAAPAIFASAATVVVGMLCLMFAELNSTAGLGPANAVGVGRHLPGDGHPAARAAGHLRPLGVLAQAPDVRLRRAHRVRLLGPRRQPDRAAARARSGSSRPACCCVACLGLFRLDTSGLSTEDAYTKEFDSIEGQKLLAEHGLVDSSNTDPGRREHRPGRRGRRRRSAGIDGLGEPATPPSDRQRRSYFEATINADISSTSQPSTSSRPSATPCTASTAPTPWSAAGRRSTSTPRSPRTATTR